MDPENFNYAGDDDVATCDYDVGTHHVNDSRETLQ